ncbi:MAG: hypothetical protein Q4P30_05095 [Eubacteriales bacterium]|nr:hypothetical protein [Eubacteriales bacterium]
MNIWVHLAAVSGFIAAVFCMVGDAWIVGFDKNRIPDPAYHEVVKNGDYSFYIGASEKRLRRGALIGDYSTPFLLCSLYATYYLLGSGSFALATVLILGAGFAYMPLAHCAFYYLGMVYRYRYAVYKKGYDMDEEGLREMEEGIKGMLNKAWIPSIILTAVGWLMFTVYVALGYSMLPRYFAIINPLPLSFFFMLTPKIPYPGKPLLDGAAFNMAGTLYYIVLLIHLMVIG